MDQSSPPRARPAPVVRVQQGLLEGEWLEAATGDGLEYASFKGIPYALPPTGERRFKAPRPAASWDGVRKAVVPDKAIICLQGREGKWAGTEDCLYLNVCTPELPRQGKKLLPVLFWIHGGKFQYGHGGTDIFGPDYLAHEGILLVTVNYRLNSFGFLSLDTETVPGNAGLKDLVAAFQWVQQNVASFGGDPRQITAGGQSSGAACAHWLSLIPVLRGQIKNRILMSGSAFHSWAYKEDFLDVARAVGEKLSGRVLGREELGELLMKSSAEELMSATAKVIAAIEKRSPFDCTFGVTPERRSLLLNGEPALVTRDAESFFLDPSVPVIPTLLGATNREWLAQTKYFYGWKKNTEAVKKRAKNFERFVPTNIVPFEDTRRALKLPDHHLNERENFADISSAVDTHYFRKAKDTSDLLDRMCEYTDHIFIAIDTSRLAQLWAQQRCSDVAPLYVYRFSFKGDYNNWQSRDPQDKQDATAAVHGDDFGYVFHLKNRNQDYSGESLSSLMVRRMSKMWANFIVKSNPVPHTDELLPVAWTPNRSASPETTFLSISDDLSMRNEQIPVGNSVEFWNTLYAKYRRSKM